MRPVLFLLTLLVGGLALPAGAVPVEPEADHGRAATRRLAAIGYWPLVAPAYPGHARACLIRPPGLPPAGIGRVAESGMAAAPRFVATDPAVPAAPSPLQGLAAAARRGTVAASGFCR